METEERDQTAVVFHINFVVYSSILYAYEGK
jgi:hypothetical protein